MDFWKDHCPASEGTAFQRDLSAALARGSVTFWAVQADGQNVVVTGIEAEPNTYEGRAATIEESLAAAVKQMNDSPAK